MNDLPDDWTDEQQDLFTKVYKFMLVSQGAMTAPEASPIGDRDWGCICFNAAFTAAELLVNESLRIIDLDTEQTLTESPGSLNS
jgi:hypothetical protein